MIGLRLECNERFKDCFAGDFKMLLTWQEVVLGVQQGCDCVPPGHFNAGGGRLQREALRRATRPQHKLAGIAVHTVLHRQVAHLITHKNINIIPRKELPNKAPCLEPV